MITVRRFLTADNLDVLDGTDLATIPEAGVLRVYAASTQNDTTMTITGPGNEPPIRSQALILRASAEIRQNEDAPYLLGVTQGGHYIINIDVVTAATVQVQVQFFDATEVGLLAA